MPKISAVIITFNEEKNIERCLQSLIGIADEIVVVDSFSTDKTEEICKKYNTRFIKHKFDGYIEQKNYATAQATYDYVLALDADESLSEELKTSIRHIKENWEYDGYRFARLTNYCGKWIRHTSWYPSKKLRLWDRRKGSWGGVNPHDKFIMEKGSRTKSIKGDLLHYSFYSINDQIFQLNKFSDILARSYYQRGKTSNYWHIIFHPAWRFTRDYFLKLGFLDGFYGLIVSANSAFEVFLKYVKLKQYIALEKQKLPSRVCFFNSSAVLGNDEEWILYNSRKLNDKGIESIIVMNPKSDFHQKVKNFDLSFFNFWSGRFSFLNPVKILMLARFFRRQRVLSVVVSSPGDLRIAAISAKIAGIKNIIFHKSEMFTIPGSIINKYFFSKAVNSVVINSKKLKYIILLYNYDLISKEKIYVLDESNNYELSEKLLSNIA